MRSSSTYLTVLCAVAVFLTGCATYRVETTGRVIDREAVEAIKPLETTRAEIIAAFGEPDETSDAGGLEKLIYRYGETKTPYYMGGIIESKKDTLVGSAVLEVVIKEGRVKTFNYKGSTDKRLYPKEEAK